MAKTKNSDIWKNVPKDKDGNYLEAATNDYGIAKASEKIISTTIEPVIKGSEIYLTAVVTGPPGGSAGWYYNGPPGASVNIRLERIPNTGGHFHGGTTNDANAVGNIAPNSFVLGAYPQNVRVIHRFPEVCGSIKIISVFSQGNPNTILNQADVLVQGLVPIVQTQSLLLKSPLPEHPSPYWGHPTFIQKLNQLSTQYFQQRNKPITVTDGCLQCGGRFDLGQNWIPPHAEHRDGHQADLRSNDMNQADKTAFLAIASAVGLNVLVEANHWHVRG